MATDHAYLHKPYRYSYYKVYENAFYAKILRHTIHSIRDRFRPKFIFKYVNVIILNSLKGTFYNTLYVLGGGLCIRLLRAQQQSPSIQLLSSTTNSRIRQIYGHTQQQQQHETAATAATTSTAATTLSTAAATAAFPTPPSSLPPSLAYVVHTHAEQHRRPPPPGRSP